MCFSECRRDLLELLGLIIVGLAPRLSDVTEPAERAHRSELGHVRHWPHWCELQRPRLHQTRLIRRPQGWKHQRNRMMWRDRVSHRASLTCGRAVPSRHFHVQGSASTGDPQMRHRFQVSHSTRLGLSCSCGGPTPPLPFSRRRLEWALTEETQISREPSDNPGTSPERPTLLWGGAPERVETRRNTRHMRHVCRNGRSCVNITKKPRE